MATPAFSLRARISAPAGGLHARVLRAGGWTVAGFALGQAIRFGANLVMTRLLVPEMFGVMAIAMMVMYGLALFSDVGLRQSVVQSRRGREAAFLDTAWTIQIARGFVIWAAALAVALVFLWFNFPHGSVYADPSLPYVVAVLSVAAIIGGFESTRLLEASRTLSLSRVTQIELAAQCFGLACMIGWALVDRSIWALVAGALGAAALRTLLSHAWLPGAANRWRWESAAAREILDVGKWIFAASALGFLVNSADRLILGALVESSVLGVYAIAFLLFSAVEQVLVKIVGEVSFPALSEVARERPAALRSAYYRFHLAVGLPACFAAGLLVAAAEPLVALLYDARYAEAGWMLRILALALVTLPFRVATQCFIVLGEPQRMTAICAIRLVALCAAVPLGWHFFGLAGALWAIVLSYFSTLPTTLAFVVRHRLFDAAKELALLPALLAGLAAGLAVTYAF
ncbi:MAG TPA: oligosaccharide flippase family protein [Burkholderiales bacterium]|nr:oligosaccharide flippase family protein [Burkholderiales bacterium]